MYRTTTPSHRAIISLCFVAVAPVAIGQTLTATIVPTNYSGYHVSCFGMKDGSATVQVTGGVPPYIYDWTTGATTASVTDLAPGYIKVRVGDPTATVPRRSSP
ncbi:MAG: SprB repeat-containing protein [Flavobacteriales bacterium]|jgi:hypothetical protein|nr:SprB repeat-containing protein [Flavobacteriales bacterium]MBK6550156.1 SprB repeat-containing protein [Flavobacteriales bacterium]MBK6881683.1 SprB repeat-containing protein [Flavobacteriales bacterium]MBK7102666.1 SprB repeat-containing protein [Flavobacteriales bacterium]MBK7113400.1 SprB repeat-containing protein [Flavobacteriales bacterium]